MFAKILIANRGEIARRVIRTARRMGIKTVAVYSEADKNAPFVREADEAVLIGPAAAKDSYLRGDIIIAAALNRDVEAIHPGYGFLSENAEFAEACEAAGIVFIGPTPSAIRAMALKGAAKALMTEAGVPVTPGYHGDDQSTDGLQKQADRIGYPVLIKAVAGGGGKGMRRVDQTADFADALVSAQREGQNAFSDAKVLIENISRCRATSRSSFSPTAMATSSTCSSAIARCSAATKRSLRKPPPPNCPNASVRPWAAPLSRPPRPSIIAVPARSSLSSTCPKGIETADFYFMEMNTRLQVEHPVTEEITGVDLVEWQLRVANGEPLPKTQEQLSIHGHAVEARLYAEDPENDFLPATGRLERLAFPPETRIESAVEQGDEVSVFYDPMIAKIVVHGKDRADALAKMRIALIHTKLKGLATNLGFPPSRRLRRRF